MRGYQRQKIIPVAGHKEQGVSVGVVKDINVRGRHWQETPEFRNFMPLAAQNGRHFRRHIVVQEKSHSFSGALIWRATNVSISARWSSY
jgi:hypothetical protein